MKPKPHPLKKLLTQKPSTPDKRITTAMTTEQYKELHELKWHKAIYAVGSTDCTCGMVVVALGTRKGSKAKIRQWLRDGCVVEK